MSDGLFGGTEASWDNFVQVFSDVLTDELRDAKIKYLRGLPGVQDWMNREPRTLVHGDFRLDNLFFKKSGPKIEVACCDFQAPVRGKGIQDVAYFERQCRYRVAPHARRRACVSLVRKS